jgi:amphi-Trp domain-containing protein
MTHRWGLGSIVWVCEPLRAWSKRACAHAIYLNGVDADNQASVTIGAQMELVELKEKTALTREEAAARLHAIADELASNNDVLIEREHIRFVAHVPDHVNLKVEFEIEDDGTELEIELTW